MNSLHLAIFPFTSCVLFQDHFVILLIIHVPKASPRSFRTQGRPDEKVIDYIHHITYKFIKFFSSNLEN